MGDKDKTNKPRNPVAKNMWLYSRATVEKDKTKYNKKSKHKNKCLHDGDI